MSDQTIPETAVPTHNKSYNLDNNRGNPRVNHDLRTMVVAELFQDMRIDSRNIKVNVINHDDVELVGTVPDERMIEFVNEDIRAMGHLNFVNHLTVQ